MSWLMGRPGFGTGSHCSSPPPRKSSITITAPLDLALEDELKIQYTVAVFNTNEARVRELIMDPRTMIGASDGGAHVDMICDAGYCTSLLGTWVREKGVMSLEYAVKRLTSEPANFFGIQDTGKLAPRMAADIVIFDYNTIGSGKRPEMRYDLPGGGRRLVMPAQGMHYIIVNGEVLYEELKPTGALPGKVLRLGADYKGLRGAAI